MAKKFFLLAEVINHQIYDTLIGVVSKNVQHLVASYLKIQTNELLFNFLNSYKFHASKTISFV